MMPISSRTPSAVSLLLFSVTMATSAVQDSRLSELLQKSYKTRDMRLTYLEIAAFKQKQQRSSRASHLENLLSSSPNPTPRVEEVYEAVICPADQCRCTKDTDKTPAYLQINCRYANLDKMPTFRATDITFDELTFSMGNSITLIPNGAFRNLRVKKIDLEENNVQEVEDGAFVGLEPVLETLYLQGNGNVQIPYDKIVNLANLKHLKLTNYRDRFIPGNNRLGSFERLETLELHKVQQLSVIEHQAFRDKLPMLTELVLDGVGFDAIPVAALQELNTLRKLVINNAPISVIYANSFASNSFQSLQELELQSNKIEYIHSNAFEIVSNSLEILDLTNNYLNKTSLSAFASKPWRKLHTLNLSYNSRIGTVSPGTFQNMAKLQYLNLMSTNLQIVKADMFTGLTSLISLELSYNRILGILTAAFSGMPALEDLRLGYQSYDDPDQTLHLNLNPSMFNGVTGTLRDLSVEGTPLRADYFWRTLHVLTALQTLRASETGLHTIPDNAFVNNPELHVIELGQNGINELTNSAFLGLKGSLRELMLQSNDLTSISECVFKGFTNLQKLMLINNRLHCDCKLVWLHRFIARRSLEDPTFQKYNYQCGSPLKLQDKRLYRVPVSDLCPVSPVTPCHYVTAVPTTAGTTATATSATTVSATVSAATTPTPVTTRPPVSSSPTPSSAKPTSTPVPAEIQLYVGGTTETSFTLYWNLHGNKEPIKGFKLEYSSVIDNVKLTVPIHPERTGYEIKGLKPAMFYKICITVEYLSGETWPPGTGSDASCKTRQTLSQAAQQGGVQEDSPGNTLVIVLVTTGIVVVLIIAGLYMLVKYKIQKLKELRHLTMGSPGLAKDYCGQDESSSCAPNEYTEMQAAKKAQYNIYSTKQLQRQLAGDNTHHDRAYSTYHKIKDSKRPKHTEEPEQEVKDKEYSKVDEVSKTEIVQRNSAPSRLDAGDLFKSGKRGALVRPLPATPTDHAKSGKGDSKDKESTTVFMTQASVYEPTVPETPELEEEEEKQEKIYAEINGTDTLPKK